MLLILKILQELDSIVFGNTISSLLEIWYNRHAIGVRKKNKRTKFPILSVYSFIQKHFVKGIIIGAVKG